MPGGYENIIPFRLLYGAKSLPADRKIKPDGGGGRRKPVTQDVRSRNASSNARKRPEVS